MTAAARRHGVVAGVHANAALTDKRTEQGFIIVTVAVDLPLLTEGLTRSLRDGRDAVETGEA